MSARKIVGLRVKCLMCEWLSVERVEEIKREMNHVKWLEYIDGK